MSAKNSDHYGGITLYLVAETLSQLRRQNTLHVLRQELAYGVVQCSVSCSRFVHVMYKGDQEASVLLFGQRRRSLGRNNLPVFELPRLCHNSV